MPPRAPPKDRDIAMVFQSYALYPHMTVFDNMAFSLKLRKAYFPVREIDTENPEYIEKEQALDKAYDEETEAGINEIKNNSKDLPKKIVTAKINEFTYRQKKKYKALYENLKDEYSSPVMSFDTEKAKEISTKISELMKKEPVDEKAINELKEQLDKIESTKDTPMMAYRHYSNDEMAQKVAIAADILGLEPYLKRKPAALSGGQRQRVALGRAIVRNPKVFLMDEPLSNLDAKLRVQMRSEIIKIHKRVGATTIYVTHDQTEAMTMATRIVCMKDGWVQQIGTPKELFNTPANMFVAGFIGSPAMNFVHGTFNGEAFISENELFSIKLDSHWKNILKDYKDKEVVLGIRPEDAYVDGANMLTNPSNPIELECDISELLGRELIIYNNVGTQRLVIRINTRDDIKTGDIIKYVFDMDRVHFFDPETTNRIC